MFSLKVQQGEKFFEHTFQAFLGGRCGSKYCQCRREHGGVETDTRKIRVGQKKKSDADEGGRQKQRRNKKGRAS